MVGRNPFEAYRNMSKQALTGRDIEADVLTRMAQQLMTCKEDLNSKEGVERLNAALRKNQKIWSIFQAELSDESNPLPKELKENLLKLSIYIDKCTFQLLREPEAEKLDSIIAINQNIAAGLRGSVSDGS